MKKLLLIFTIGLFTALLLFGCNNIDPNASPQMITESPTMSLPTATPEQTPEVTPPPVEPTETPVPPPPTPTPAPPVPLINKIKMTAEQRAGKVAYITIDDGPSRNTPALLAMLRGKNVKVTFFVLGRNAEAHPQYIKDIAADGHVIGNHSYSHVYKQIYASPDTLREEIVHTNNVIKNILGQDYQVTLFRFPGGLKQSDPAYVQVVTDLGMDFYAWNIDPKDSGGSKSTTEALVAKFNSQLGSMKHPVILMHDAANKDTSVQALAVMIDQLRAKGYSFDVITRP